MVKVLIRQVRGRKKAPNWRGIVDEVGKDVDAIVKPKLKRRFEEVVADWKHRPKFGLRKRINRKEIAVFVFPQGEHKKIWEYVSRGTRKHEIKPKGNYPLRFMWGGVGSYKPKTRAKGKFGGPGIVVGGELTFRMSVNHPGSEGRLFEETIGEDETPEFRRVVENAMRRGARKA